MYFQIDRENGISGKILNHFFKFNLHVTICGYTYTVSIKFILNSEDYFIDYYFDHTPTGLISLRKIQNCHVFYYGISGHNPILSTFKNWNTYRYNFEWSYIPSFHVDNIIFQLLFALEQIPLTK